jgi:Chaperone of endosialidase
VGVLGDLESAGKFASGYDVLKSGYDAYKGEGAPPGVAGPATAGQPVVYDPGTGLYVNQATGAVSTDSAGQHPVSDPSLATQATRNLATSQQFLSTLGQYGQQYNGAQAAESSLAGKLNATIAGTAPSVARSQLESGLSQIVQQQQSQASGATGEGGALARVGAANNTANAQTATNAQTAGLRAQEVAGAEGALGSLDANQASQALTASGQGQTAAGNFANLAGGEEGNTESLTQSGGKNQLTTLGTIAQAGGGAAGVPGGTFQGPGSDENMKTDIKPADMSDFMGKLSAIAFKYKDPAEGEGQRIGIKAQDAKKSKVGKSIVKGSSPMRLDGGNAIGAALAGLADHEARMRKLEGSRAA